VDEEGVEGQPIFPVEQGGQTLPKFQLDETGETGELIVEPKDLEGEFDYIPDVESMSITRSSQSRMKLFALNLLQNPNVIGLLREQQVQPKMHDLLVEMLEDSGFKDARRFFQDVPSAPQPQASELGGGLADGQVQQGQEQEQVNPAGGELTAPGIPSSGSGTDGRLLGNPEARAGETNI
jgi:hypothetical protein